MIIFGLTRTRRHRRVGVIAAVGALVASMLLMPTGAASASATAATVTAATAASGITPGTAFLRTSAGGYWALGTRANGQVFRLLRKSTGSWYAPQQFGGTMTAGPAATYTAATNRVDVYSVFSDGSLRTARSVAGPWSPWSRIASGVTGGVSAVLAKDGVHVLVIGTNSHLYHLVRKDGQWVRVDLGGSFARSSAIAYYAPLNKFDVFATATDGRILHRSWQGGWSGWSAVTGSGFNGVGAVRIGRSLKLIAVNNNRKVYEIGSAAGRWTRPRSIGGSAFGTPSVAGTSTYVRVLVNGIDGYLATTVWHGGRWAGWSRLPASGFPKASPPPAPAPTRVTLAKTLLSRWGGRLTGLAGAKSDLQVTAAGRAVTSCGRAVYLDPRMLTAIVKATNKYQVFVNNMVTGHSCDSGYHPQGKAVDFNTVIDPATGRRTNWHSYESGDNRALDAEFLSYTASAITSGGGAGQVNCPGSAHAPVPAGMLRFSDYCNHQHIDSR